MRGETRGTSVTGENYSEFQTTVGSRALRYTLIIADLDSSMWGDKELGTTAVVRANIAWI